MKVKKINDEDLHKIKIFLSNETGDKNDKYEKLFNYWWFENPAYLNKYDKGYFLYNEKLDQVVGFIGKYPSFFSWMTYLNNYLGFHICLSFHVYMRSSHFRILSCITKCHE